MSKMIVFLAAVFFLQGAYGGERVLPGLNEVQGTTENYQIADKDGLADFSLVIPAMSAEELATFDMARIFSPESDTIKILAFSLALPSNLSVPKQTESYILPFTVEKNQFRIFLPDGTYNMYALRGQFPVKDVIQGLQNKLTLFDLINLFKFYGGGTEAVKTSSGADLNIDVNKVQFNSTFNLAAPSFGGGKVLLALGLVKTGGEFYPTDVKRLTTGQTTALTIRAGDQYAFSILLNDAQRPLSEEFFAGIFENIWDTKSTTDFSQMSYALQKVKGTVTPTLLASIPAPVFDKAKATVTATPPAAVSGIAATQTYLVLSETQAGTGLVPTSFKQTLWSTTVPGWQKSFSIPASAMTLIKNQSYSWDVMYMGNDGTLSDVTHVTRNAVNF